MSVSIAKIRPFVLVVATALAGSAAVAFAFEAGRTSDEAADAPGFPAFIGAQQFAELAAAHKSLTHQPQGNSVEHPSVATEVRQRAEELSRRFHGPGDISATPSAVEPAAEKQTAWEAAARRAAEEIARESSRSMPQAELPAATIPSPPSAAADKAPAKAGAGASRSPKLSTSPGGTAPAKAGADSKGTAAKSATQPLSGKQAPILPAAIKTATGAISPAPLPRGKENKSFAPPSALGAVWNSIKLPAGFRPKVLPTELGVFGWDGVPD